ncbi:MAG TPA: hypothetical protein VFY99_06690 [Solirubrobacterales bacterium]
MPNGPTVRGAWERARRTFARHWRVLAFFGAVIFIPLGLLEVLAHEIGEVEIDELSDTAAWVLAGVGVATVVTALLGEIFFSGVVAAAVSEAHGAQSPTLAELRRSIPYGTLIAIDLLSAIGVALGLVLLIVPALLFLGYFGLAAPMAKIEHLGVRAAFGRSRRLARGHLGLVLLILVPVSLAGQLLSAGAGEGIGELLGESFAAEWFAASASELLSTPIWALATVALAFELLAAEDAADQE